MQTNAQNRAMWGVFIISTQKKGLVVLGLLYLERLLLGMLAAVLAGVAGLALWATVTGGMPVQLLMSLSPWSLILFAGLWLVCGALYWCWSSRHMRSPQHFPRMWAMYALSWVGAVLCSSLVFNMPVWSVAR